MDAEALAARLRALVGEDAVAGVIAAEGGVRDAVVRVAIPRWPAVARVLRDEPDLAYDFLDCVTAVDRPKDGRVDVVYHLFSYRHRRLLVVRLEAPRQDARVPSVVAVWPTAEWHEREQYDLFGVRFDGHPDLRRLLMPEDWPNHPMRKDAVHPASYRGMPTTRPNTLDLLPTSVLVRK
jgi:NADH-quinone oxidoreductase subunit C